MKSEPNWKRWRGRHLPAWPRCDALSDPPYYAAIPYADCADFFYAWLKASLQSVHPGLFSGELTPKAKKLVRRILRQCLDADLQQVIVTWDELPATIRKAVVALIGSQE